jgi:2-polyprenyl-3-methyl-5-hydroxy-6-metoxy-1,4-benzoquinol methylase
MLRIQTFFDRQYAMHERYWWREENRYSIEPAAHTPYNAMLLAVAARREHGRALDLGAGEGADAIRLAKLGYHVDAVEMSAVACEKIEHFARAQGVKVHIRNELLESVDLTGISYDLVIMNGCLHYVRDKNYVLQRVLAASAKNAVHAIALFSTATPVPAEHAVVPVFPDEEGGLVERFYHDWDMLLLAHERGRSERSHPGFAPHVHSYIKLIAARSDRTVNGR